MKTPKSLYSRLALVTSVTLVVGYFVVYAAWTNLILSDADGGKILSSTLLKWIMTSVNDIWTRTDGIVSNGTNIWLWSINSNSKLNILADPTNYSAITLARNIGDNNNNGAIITGWRKVQSNLPFSSYGSWDTWIARTVSIGWWGWNRPDATEIRFYTAPAYDEGINSSFERMRIDNNGYVWVGTMTPEHKLQVSGAGYIINAYNPSVTTVDSARISLRTWLTGSATAGFEIDIMNDSAYTAGQKAVIQAYRYNGGWVPLDIGIIGGNVGIGAMPPLATTYKLYVSWNTYTTWTYWSSDIRWKKNINTLDWALDKIEKLRWVTFDWKHDEYKNMNFDTGAQIWFIAQEIEEVIPELVKTDSNWYKAVAYDKFSAILLEAIKEQQGQILELKNEIQELKNK